MGTRITEQLDAIARRIRDFERDPDYREFARLLEQAGCDVEMPEVLARYSDRAGSIDLDRARRELGGDDNAAS